MRCFLLTCLYGILSLASETRAVEVRQSSGPFDGSDAQQIETPQAERLPDAPRSIATRKIAASAAAEAPSAVRLPSVSTDRRGEPRSTPYGPLRTAGGVLLICGGLLTAMWLLRGPQQARAVLPAGVAESLGAVPWAGRAPLHLLRLGNKLVLVATHGTQIQAVTEVTDPDEVKRLMELCRMRAKSSGVESDASMPETLKMTTDYERLDGFGRNMSCA